MHQVQLNLLLLREPGISQIEVCKHQGLRRTCHWKSDSAEPTKSRRGPEAKVRASHANYCSYNVVGTSARRGEAQNTSTFLGSGPFGFKHKILLDIFLRHRKALVRKLLPDDINNA